MAGKNITRTLKVGSRVQAKTIRETEFLPGTVTDVRQGPTGIWYSVKRKDKVINTRASCIK